MYELAKIEKYRVNKESTELIISIPKDISYIITDKRIKKCEMRFDDGRHISSEQRKKAYATIKDIAAWSGYLPEEQKEWLKYLHIAKTGCEYFSLSSCTVDTAREFINTILEYVVENGVPLTDLASSRTDDIGRYLYFCLKNKKCAVCGKYGEIHHWDAIGMGSDRKKVDDSKHRKICLCRTHHTIAHQRGNTAFEKMYKVYGITYEEGSENDVQSSRTTAG